jgi:hypothetical protein
LARWCETIVIEKRGQTISEGYVTLATGAQRYFDMAAMFALSARVNDPARAVCLVTDENSMVPEYAATIFDVVVKMKSSSEYVGCTNKIRLHEVAPFQRNMYVDADCLLVKREIDGIWREARGSAFTMTGEKRTSGHWNQLDIAWACKQFQVPYVVQMNSGVFYWERGDAATDFFAHVKHLFEHHRNKISNIHQGRAGQYADEPIFGLAMGSFGINPLEEPHASGSWMVTTWRARNCRFDVFSGESYLRKAAGFRLFGRFWADRWVEHSPIIAHFIGLKPRGLYRAQCARLLDWANHKGHYSARLTLPI